MIAAQGGVDPLLNRHRIVEGFPQPAIDHLVLCGIRQPQTLSGSDDPFPSVEYPGLIVGFIVKDEGLHLKALGKMGHNDGQNGILRCDGSIKNAALHPGKADKLPEHSRLPAHQRRQLLHRQHPGIRQPKVDFRPDFQAQPDILIDLIALLLVVGEEGGPQEVGILPANLPANPSLHPLRLDGVGKDFLIPGPQQLLTAWPGDGRRSRPPGVGFKHGGQQALKAAVMDINHI